MVKGTTVIITGNRGHEDKLTLHKTYEVLDDRPTDQLVRIRDDRRRMVWMQKHYFDLVSE